MTAMKLLLPLVVLISLHFGLSSQYQHVLSRLNLEKAVVNFDDSAYIEAETQFLGTWEDHVAYVTVNYQGPASGATDQDWVAVFSPSNFNSSVCLDDYNGPNRDWPPNICTAPIKFQFANFSSPDYVKTGKGSLTFRLINQRSDFSFALFSGVYDPVLIAKSKTPVTFPNLKMPLYARLAQGKSWNEMTVTWTSGYKPSEGVPFISWKDDFSSWKHATAKTFTLTRGDMCGPPASTVGWRDPGQYHTGEIPDLLPNTKYSYRFGHRLPNKVVVLGPIQHFKSSPYPGEESLQKVVIYGDLGKMERDRSMVYDDFQPGTLNTTDTLVKEIDDIDIIFHIGDLSYATGYISEWDQFTEQIQGLTSRVPYMIASGNHERDWPNSGSYYNSTDSGGECGLFSSSVFNMPVKNKEKFWYSTDYGLFHFCIVDSEHDWREGTEQYQWLEQCLANVDRQRQPWLIFIAHRVLGYSSWYTWFEGTTGEPESLENLQKLWQKYKVDIAFYGHVHNYERTCPVYDQVCMSDEPHVYSGQFNATIHVVAGGAGCSLTPFPSDMPAWSLKQDLDFGYTKMTAFNRSTLLFEYKKSSDGQVYDHFWINRQYKDVLGCDAPNKFCPETTAAI